MGSTFDALHRRGLIRGASAFLLNNVQYEVVMGSIKNDSVPFLWTRFFGAGAAQRRPGCGRSIPASGGKRQRERGGRWAITRSVVRVGAEAARRNDGAADPAQGAMELFERSFQLVF